MIQLTGAAKRYGPKILFENVDWLVTPNERAGIVGANGTGKSSLLKVLAGMEGLDSGSITVQRGATIGYLPQEGLSLSGRSVFAECMTVFAGLRALEDEQEQLTSDMRICRWQDGAGWTAIPTYLPLGFRFAVAPLDRVSGDTLIDPSRPASGLRVEYYKICWIPRKAATE